MTYYIMSLSREKNIWPKQPALLQRTLSVSCVLHLSINSIMFGMCFSMWILYCVLWCSDWDTQTAPPLRYPGPLPQGDWHLLTSKPGSGWALPGCPGSTLITWLRWLSSCGFLPSLCCFIQTVPPILECELHGKGGPCFLHFMVVLNRLFLPPSIAQGTNKQMS